MSLVRMPRSGKHEQPSRIKAFRRKDILDPQLCSCPATKLIHGSPNRLTFAYAVHDHVGDTLQMHSGSQPDGSKRIMDSWLFRILAGLYTYDMRDLNICQRQEDEASLRCAKSPNGTDKCHGFRRACSPHIREFQAYIGLASFVAAPE